jgi:hypothetical protein
MVVGQLNSFVQSEDEPETGYQYEAISKISLQKDKWNSTAIEVMLF